VRYTFYTISPHLYQGFSVQNDPVKIISDSPMSRFQIAAIAITVCLNGLDGFDVLAISFASPGIAEEWGIQHSMLGIVLAVELMGMALGSVLIGQMADHSGRRPLILGCLVTMTGGMLLAATSANITQLIIWRVLTGLGIGGMLAVVNATAAEFSNAKNRNTAIALMAAGYPLGAILGGSVSAYLLQLYDWRSVFYCGGMVSALILPLAWYFLPETIAFLAHKQPPCALARINRALARMGHPLATHLPEPTQHTRQIHQIKELFGRALLPVTLLLTLAQFAHSATFYFILKWTPKIIVDMGYLASSAAAVLAWASVGGAVGGMSFSLLVRRCPLMGLTIGAMIASVVMVNVFGNTPASLRTLALIVATAGFFINAGIVGLYALFAQLFEARLRASGTGLVIGIGRGGAALSPIIAGFLFEGGFGLASVALIMSIGSLLAAAALLLLLTRFKTDI